MLAKYCFSHSIRTLSGMDDLVAKMFKLGLVSLDALTQYISSLRDIDEKIKGILRKLGLSRLVNTYDRDFYATWTNSWNMSEELIDYAAMISAGKGQPMQYMNKILSNWHAKGITTVKEAEEFLPKPEGKTFAPKAQKEGWEREYKKEDLEAVFDSLEDIEI